MLEFILHNLSHTFFDIVNLVPFLLLTYLVLEFIEHKASNRVAILAKRTGALGPVIGSALGLVPQCGFSASASNLYAQKLISAGTLLAVFISTSDEMLPILISESVGADFIIRILAIKLLSGILVGILVDTFFRFKLSSAEDINIHAMCEHDGCGCEDGNIFISAVKHTVQILVFIFLISFALNLVIHYVGEDFLKELILNKPVIGPLISSLVGLIPNCASSIVITELYLSGAMSTGAMIAGLISSAGIGVLVLFRVNRAHMKKNLLILSLLYSSGVIIGILSDLAGLVL